MSGYFKPEVLVTTEWLAQNLDDPSVKIIEVSEAEELYAEGHIPGAHAVSWTHDLRDGLRRDFIDQPGLAQLLGSKGISAQDTVILYGDRHNWFATYAYWLFKVLGHDNLRLLNGGRTLWEKEGRPLTTDVPSTEPVTYTPGPANPEHRAFSQDILPRLGTPDFGLVDVRSADEFSGVRVAMPGFANEGAQVGGHIPGAANLPWGLNVNEDGTFKDAAELRKLYEEAGIKPEQEVITYCRIGERASISWFVLTELLGYPTVRNYDGSWTEWGNIVDVPVAKGAQSDAAAS